MDSIHDMGGMDGFGEVDPDDDVVYHALWEEKVFGMCSTVSSQGVYTVDEFRHARERLDPRVYLGSTYWGNWLNALETLVLEKGIVDEEELLSRVDNLGAAERYEDGLPRRRDTDLVQRVEQKIRNVTSNHREPSDQRFVPGDEVIVAKMHPEGHTRCPRYVRGAHGTVEELHGAFTLADANAHGRDAVEPLYSVVFDSEELWGQQGEANETVSLDLWESYLEGAR